MVISENRLFPYPVLCKFNDDYVGSDFSVDIKVNIFKTHVEINVDLKLCDKELNNLVLSNKAEFVCHLECSKTKYRDMLKLNLGNNILKIAGNKLNGKLNILTLIVAIQNINNYTNPNFNPDYNNIGFDINAGSILAIANQMNVNIEKDITDLSKLPSVISIIRNPSNQNDNTVKYDYSGDKIYIYLCNIDYNKYANLPKNDEFASITISTIIVPVLVSILFQLRKKEVYEEFSDKKWFTAIKNNLKRISEDLNYEYITSNEPFEIVQKIFDMPVHTSLENLSKLRFGDD